MRCFMLAPHRRCCATPSVSSSSSTSRTNCPTTRRFVFPALAIAALVAIAILQRRDEWQRAFAASSLLIVGLLATMAAALYPNILLAHQGRPYGLTIHNAASGHHALVRSDRSARSTSPASRGPSRGSSGVAAMRKTTSFASTSSRVIRGEPRIGVSIDPFSSSSMSSGVEPGRSRARRSTAAGSPQRHHRDVSPVSLLHWASSIGLDGRRATSQRRRGEARALPWGSIVLPPEPKRGKQVCDERS